MTTSSRKPPSREAQNALLGDLESIRSLLEGDVARSSRETAPAPEDDIPTLDDVVDAAALHAEQSARVERAPFATAPAAGLADDAFDALLGDQWREKADRILEDARARLDERVTTWSTSEANDFMQSLQSRLNEVVRGWLAEVVRRELEDLRETLTAAIEIEIDAFSLRTKGPSEDAD